MALTDMVALVTGAGSGMGRAMVEEFVAEGARVAAVDIDREKAEATVTGLADPSRALVIQADVADSDSVSRCVDTALKWGGRLDVLCNNAGVLDSYRPAQI